MSFLSYAQNNEDVLLWRALGHVPHGFYIDVGANSPIEHSVTKAFYDAGWRGINIEPMPSYAAAFAQQRERDINLTLAAGAVEGEITLFDVPDVNGWATVDATVARAHQAEGHALTETRVPLRTLAAICAEHVSGPIHFLKIDVEGFEGDVLRGMDFARWRPWIVVIEATLPGSRVCNHAAWEDLITGARYQFAWFDGLNRYYVAQEHAELMDALTIQPNVFDDFISYHLDHAWARNARLEKNNAQLEQRAQELDLHGQQLATQIGALAEQVEQLARHGQRVEHELQQVSDQLLQTQAQLRQSDARALAFEASLHQSAEWAKGLEQQLLAVFASSSWRITAPLRAIMRRGERSLFNIAKRRAAGAMRRAVRWLTQRQALRRALLPLLMRFPGLSEQVTRSLSIIKHGPSNAGQGADVPHLLRELPPSARKVLADLRRAQHPSNDPPCA
ncbi:MAG: FkbM family methyltransferase [Pseudomonadota bacterium]